MTEPDFGTAALLSEPTNYAVVQLPQRKSPGVVFQGDSLHALRQELHALCSIEDPAELRSEAAVLAKNLDDIVSWYVEVVARQGGALPFDVTE